MIEIFRVLGAAISRGAMADKTPPIFATRREHDAQSVQRFGIAAIAPDTFAQSLKILDEPVQVWSLT